MDRRLFLTLGAICAGTTLWGSVEEIDSTVLGTSNVSRTVLSLINKLNIVQNRVGYVQFNILSFDELLKEAAYCGKPINNAEIALIESIFYGDPKKYGFYGERTVGNLTLTTSRKDVIYVDKTGHFLMRGQAAEKYTQLKKLIGNDLILTSGVRAPVKQLHLFLKKMANSNGDLRLTSTSIAPPGFTFHSIGDFDIGKVGYGYANFTDKFQETDIYKRLSEGGYITIRYNCNNPYGVRYEPWHIKVVGGSETA